MHAPVWACLCVCVCVCECVCVCVCVCKSAQLHMLHGYEDKNMSFSHAIPVILTAPRSPPLLLLHLLFHLRLLLSVHLAMPRSVERIGSSRLVCHVNGRERKFSGA